MNDSPSRSQKACSHYKGSLTVALPAHTVWSSRLEADAAPAPSIQDAAAQMTWTFMPSQHGYQSWRQPCCAALHAARITWAAVNDCQSGVATENAMKQNREHEEGELKACLGIICLHRAQMPQVTLVPHQHDDNVRVCVVPELLQPPLHILKCHCATQVKASFGP